MRMNDTIHMSGNLVPAPRSCRCKKPDLTRGKKILFAQGSFTVFWRVREGPCNHVDEHPVFYLAASNTQHWPLHRTSSLSFFLSSLGFEDPN